MFLVAFRENPDADLVTETIDGVGDGSTTTDTDDD
jgi:hypothetical protein